MRRNGPNALANLADITILISGSAQGGVELALELEQRNARVISLPKIELGVAADGDALDESIANLFGYDWIVFKSVAAVDYFLRRFRELDHETSDLDSLRICAIGEATLRQLEGSQIHVDLSVDSYANEVFKTFENYLGGHEALRGMNFLIPDAGPRLSFSEAFVAAGARVDHVAAYGILEDNVELSRISALILGGAIDAIVFSDPKGVESFANLIATEDMSQVQPPIVMFCLGAGTAQAASGFGFKLETTEPNADAAVAISQALTGPPARR